MRFAMQPYATEGVLAGSASGQKTFVDLIQKTPPVAKPEVCFLDFSGVSVATTSFLRDSVVAYRNHARSHSSYLYPVAANLAPAVMEEFSAFLEGRGDAFVVCDLDNEDQATNVRIIGQVEGKQLNALKAVLTLGETDAPTLAKGEEKAPPTAWNNRLAALSAKGLLIEVSMGRNKRYRPVLEGLTYGS